MRQPRHRLRPVFGHLSLGCISSRSRDANFSRNGRQWGGITPTSQQRLGSPKQRVSGAAQMVQDAEMVGLHDRQQRSRRSGGGPAGVERNGLPQLGQFALSISDGDGARADRQLLRRQRRDLCLGQQRRQMSARRPAGENDRPGDALRRSLLLQPIQCPPQLLDDPGEAGLGCQGVPGQGCGPAACSRQSPAGPGRPLAHPAVAAAARRRRPARCRGGAARHRPAPLRVSRRGRQGPRNPAGSRPPPAVAPLPAVRRVSAGRRRAARHARAGAAPCRRSRTPCSDRRCWCAGSCEPGRARRSAPVRARRDPGRGSGYGQPGVAYSR